MTHLSDTHRRAAIRGNESVALWRINSGVWAARLFAIYFAIFAIVPLLKRDGPNWIGAAILVLIAVWMLVGSELLRAGSRVAAMLLLAVFVAAKISTWLLLGQPLYSSLLWTIIIGGALANGVWGTLELDATRRAALLVPPPPAPTKSRRPLV